jgi:hypothetical protein
LQKPSDCLGIEAERRAQQLERDVRIQIFPICLVHDAHATGADLAFDPVFPGD